MESMRFDDETIWSMLLGGNRTSYDPRPALARIVVNWNDTAAWDELWSELHHQGDVGDASYATVPRLVDIARTVEKRGWQFYALVATIEVGRHARSSPQLPHWLVVDYARAWSTLLELALVDLRMTSDRLLVTSAMATLALVKGYTKVGALLTDLTDAELDEVVEATMAWSAHYRDDLPPPTELQ
jgi:hypothetical protein